MNKLRKIFLIGHPRSGQADLLKRLSKDTNYLCLSETNCFSKIISSPFPLNLFGLVHIKSYKSFINNMEQDFGVCPNYSFSKKEALKNTLQFFDTITLKYKAKGWIESSYAHLYTISKIEDVSGDYEFFHFIKNPYDILSSHLELNQKYPNYWKLSSPEEIIRKWIKSVEVSMANCDRLNHHLVFSEDLSGKGYSDFLELHNFDEIKELKIPFVDRSSPWGESEEDQNIRWKANKKTQSLIESFLSKHEILNRYSINNS